MNEFAVDVVRPALGGGVARAPDGRVVFVRHALVGERVRVRVTEESARFLRGDAVEVERPAPGRVAPPCPHAGPGRCGGCDLQHADGETERAWKEAIVAEQLRRVARLDHAVALEAAPSAPAGSRTRLRCGVDASGGLGLRRARSHDLESLDACWLADDRLRPAFARRWDGAREVELRAIGDGPPLAIATWADGSSTALDLAGAPLEGAHSVARVAGRDYRVSPRSFWQSHRDAPEVLAEAVARAARVGPGDRVLDLYGGVGLFSVALADAVGPGGRVVCVESSPDAAADARANASSRPWVEVRESRVAPDALGDDPADAVVVVDPPRTGLGRGVAAALARARPRRVVYVSCDAATLARDLRTFLDARFDLVGLAAYDLFPKTEHVELVACLDAVA